MNALWQDFRFAVRQLRKSPGFTLTVIVTLALGIGANTAIFTLFDQALLRMLPVHRPQELVRFEWTGAFNGSQSSFGGGNEHYFSYPMYKDLRDKNQVFTSIAASDKAGAGIAWHNQAEEKEIEVVTGNYFELLGVKPAMGRLFSMQDETQPDANPVAVLSYEYWRTRFNGDRNVVGQTVQINGRAFEIVGIAPELFHSAIGGYRPALFMPVTMAYVVMPWRADRHDLTSHTATWLALVARLKPDVTQARAQASMALLWRSLRQAELPLMGNTSDRFKRRFVDESKFTVADNSKGFAPQRSDLETPLVILMSMSGLLAAMCAINVATLLLLRAAARAREMSMRYALGAKRSRVAAQLLVEGGLLGLAGAAAGLLLAPPVTTLLVRLMSGSEPGNEPYSSAIDVRILFFTLALGFLVSLLFSIAPVLHFLRPNLAQSLRQNAGTASRGSQRFRKIAVGAQIALSVILLAGAGLFVRTLQNLRKADVGFNTTHLVEFVFFPEDSGYTGDRVPRAVTDVIGALSRIPGVTFVAATDDPELRGGNESTNFSVQGYKAAPDEDMSVEEPHITPGYFATLRQPLLAGREFTEADGQGQPSVAVVNLAFVKKFFGTPQNALGRLIAQGEGSTVKYDTTIIGVVGDTRHTDMRTPEGRAVYRAYFQSKHPTGVEIYLRTTSDPKQIEGSVRAAIHALDPALVVVDLRTMEEQIDESASNELAVAYLAIGFSALALVMAAVGLYGVLAYSTEQRTREIGVRLALGAQRWSVIALVLREMVLIAAIATAIALPVTIALARLLKSQLYEVTPADPITLTGAVAVTALMVVLAALLPARRAAAVEPMRALRTE